VAAKAASKLPSGAQRDIPRATPLGQTGD